IGEPAPPISQFVPDVPKRVAELIESCMAKDPAQRPRSARVLATQLMTACRMLERTQAAPVPRSTTNNVIVEELAQQLTRQEQSSAELESVGVEVPARVNVRGANSTAPVENARGERDSGANFSFSEVPPVRAVASSRSEERDPESRSESLPRAAGSSVAASSFNAKT